jgi:hypothetical protein
MQRKLLGISSVDIDTIAQDHIFCILQILEKKWKYNEAMHQLFKEFKKAMIQLAGKSCIIFSVSLVSP